MMGNAAIYKTTAVKKVMYEKEGGYLCTAFLSPKLNPVEECFSKVKNFIRSEHSRNNKDLTNVVEQVFANLKVSNCQGYIRNRKSFFTMSVNEQPIETAVEINDGIESEFNF